jgi:hypothetical protein
MNRKLVTTLKNDYAGNETETHVKQLNECERAKADGIFIFIKLKTRSMDFVLL